MPKAPIAHSSPFRCPGRAEEPESVRPPGPHRVGSEREWGTWRAGHSGTECRKQVVWGQVMKSLHAVIGDILTCSRRKGVVENCSVEPLSHWVIWLVKRVSLEVIGNVGSLGSPRGMAPHLPSFFPPRLNVSIFGYAESSLLHVSCCRERGLLSAVHGLLIVVSSLVVEHRLSSCGTWALLLWGMWNLPGAGIEPVSPELAVDSLPLNHSKLPS